MRLPDLTGVRALITGAGNGIGRGLAIALALQGAQVAVLDLDVAAANDTAAAIAELGQKAIVSRLDVTDETEVDDVVHTVCQAMGGADLLVNNAGVLTTANVTDLSLQAWERVLRVNLTGVFLTSKAFARTLLDAGIAGSIVNIASIAARRGDPGLAHYAASKFGVIGFTQSLAMELAEHDITVNAVCPGVVETPMLTNLSAGSGRSAVDYTAQQLVKRPQRPDEIAQAIAFLHRCRSVTGQAINVDGGTVFS